MGRHKSNNRAKDRDKDKVQEDHMDKDKWVKGDLDRHMVSLVTDQVKDRGNIKDKDNRNHNHRNIRFSNSGYSR
jgi:hypothetical protein